MRRFPESAAPPRRSARRCVTAPLSATVHLSAILLLSALMLSSAAPAAPGTAKQDTKALAGQTRERLLFDSGWRFALGSAASADDDFGYGSGAPFAKAGDSFGPPKPGFDDGAWRLLDLPHDWAVELEPACVKDDNIKNHGYKPIGREFPKTSVGWYRRTFAVPESDRGRRLALKFDGVFRDCRVWLNGHYLGSNLSGYSEFSFDISDYVRYGEKNVVAVRVDATQGEGWFYEGAGIYRHVWLLKYGPVHIPDHGVFVHATVGTGAAQVHAETALLNTESSPATVDLSVSVVDDRGTSVGKAVTRGVRLDQLLEKTVNQTVVVPTPRLWSPESPTLYSVHSVLKSRGKVLDSVVTEFGIRSALFDKDNGFLLNGVPVKLKGVCCHQDHAGVGAALPDGLQYYRIRLLKQMGCNAYRTSHNPPTPELLEACDRLGMLVMDENRLMGSSPEIAGQFEKLILRDRNHPSVILWSLGNEEFAIQGTDIGRRIALSLTARLRQLDPTRLWTYAGNNGNQFEGINSVVPVRGFNYMAISDIDRYRREHPDQILLGSEEASTLCTRGIYANDTSRGYVSDYDLNKPDWGALAETWWKFYAAREWLAGAFVWTGFDYRGEPTPYAWPCINSHFGVMDVCGFPKNNFYYYQAWWTDRDVLHLYPHWNWRGNEGNVVDVWCQSNCETVELFLNGRSLGLKQMEPNSHLQWKVPYEPGTLEARGARQGRVLTAKVETTSPPASIVLTPDRESVRADGEDVCVVNVAALDAQGRIVPDAGNLIRFGLSGGGRILGVGNGDPSSHEPDRYLTGDYRRTLFNGMCQVIVQSLRNGEPITLQATAGGLKGANLVIRTEPSAARPSVEPFTSDFAKHRGIGKKVEYRTTYDARYPGRGPHGLVDGWLGSTEYRDDSWQGFEKEDMVAVVDLGDTVALSKMQSHFLQDASFWIFFPTRVTYEVSLDGRDFRSVATVPNDVPADRPGAMVKMFGAKFDTVRARLVRVRATNIGVCPPWHRAAGGKAWLFVDELLVE